MDGFSRVPQQMARHYLAPSAWLGGFGLPRLPVSESPLLQVPLLPPLGLDSNAHTLVKNRFTDTDLSSKTGWGADHAEDSLQGGTAGACAGEHDEGGRARIGMMQFGLNSAKGRQMMKMDRPRNTRNTRI